MKKKILYFCVAACFTTSCQDVLDVAPEGRKDLEEIFSSEVTTGAYLNGCYQQFPHLTYGDYFWTSNFVGLSDDAWEYHTVAGIPLVQAYAGNITPESSKNLLIKNIGDSGNFLNITSWDLYFRNIGRCNTFLENIDEAVVPSESDRARWKAEARVLRAFYYMELIGRFGEVPLLKSSVDMDFDSSTLKKESFKNIVDFIISECKDVIEFEPNLPWRITVASEKERMTKGVAAAIISRTILWAASPLWNNGQNYWAEAEELTKYALDKLTANGYELYSQVKNPTLFGMNAYYEYNCITTDYTTSPVDKETILASRKNLSNWWNVQGLKINSCTKAGLCPTQELVDAFPMNTGKYILDLKQPYLDENHLQPNFIEGSGYDENNPYVNRDPRFEAMIIYNGTKMKNPNDALVEVQTFNGGNCGLKMGDNKFTCTGYYPKKHYHPNQRNGRGVATTQRIMRLAEMYLNYAEAAAENGNINGAVNAIKAIRDRVGMPNIPGGTQEEVILQVRHERRIEMAYEDNRYYDIRRWCSPGQDIPVGRIQTGMWIEKEGNGKFKYMRFRVGDTYDKATSKWAGTPWERRCFTSKYLLHPLEQVEADRLYTVTGVKWQNPGW